MKLRSLVGKAAIVSGVILSAAIVSRPAMASSFQVTIEDPGVMNADKSRLKDAYVQTFDSQATGFNQNGFTWVDNGKTIGTYGSALIQQADQYGGVNGSNYLDVDTNRSGNTNYKSSTLTLTTPQKYFGLWWSAGDATNTLTFANSKTGFSETITTADVVNWIKQLPNSSKYYGNPNPTSQFGGQDGGEPFAFINFYDVDGTFDQITFGNIGGSGFESDNHTIAADYVSTSGSRLVPESSAVLGIGSIAFVGAASVMTRKKKRKTTLELS